MLNPSGILSWDFNCIQIMEMTGMVPDLMRHLTTNLVENWSENNQWIQISLGQINNKLNLNQD